CRPHPIELARFLRRIGSLAGDRRLLRAIEAEGRRDVMTPDLNFHIESAEPDLYAVAPHLVFKLRIHEGAPADVRSVILRGQVRLDPVRRHYTPREQSRLLELFGEP